MTRLFLLIVFGVVVMYYFPDSRQILVEKTKPLWVPVVKWEARDEMAQVGRDVVNHEINTGRIPKRREWLKWLDYRYATEDLKTDPWGNVYQLRVWPDSVVILSYGPDRVRNTEDDFEVAVPRPRRRR
ncbi:MAG: type II secretion system protein GspG [Gemmatimonadota bacterium]